MVERLSGSGNVVGVSGVVPVIEFLYIRITAGERWRVVSFAGGAESKIVDGIREVGDSVSDGTGIIGICGSLTVGMEVL